MKTHKQKRPWGYFEQFTQEENCTVKIININPNSKLSLQYHNFRDEFWRVLDGEVIFTLNDKKIEAKAGDELFVPKKAIHCIKAKQNPARILEIAFGHFDENDIVRLQDDYGRVNN